MVSLFRVIVLAFLICGHVDRNQRDCELLAMFMGSLCNKFSFIFVAETSSTFCGCVMLHNVTRVVNNLLVLKFHRVCSRMA